MQDDWRTLRVGHSICTLFAEENFLFLISEGIQLQSSKQMFQLNFFLYISVLYLEQKSFKIGENVYWVIEHGIITKIWNS